jgi:serine/threonine protein kinase
MGIVHNSVKPARIFLALTTQGDVAKITYGICLVEWSGSDVTSRVGTPVYMSPEQVQLGAISPRSDQWALAVTAYEVLTGQLPFLGNMNDGKLVTEICTGTPPPPSHVVRGLDTEVDRFFERALAKDPALRFPSLPEMAGAFAALTSSATP